MKVEAEQKVTDVQGLGEPAQATQVATRQKEKRSLSSYSDAMASTICAYVANQKSLRWIAKQKGMPSARTILNWLEANKDFERQYNRAREAQAESFVSEMVEMADSCQGMTGEGVRAMQLRIDTRKWVIVKLLPKKYGDRVTHDLSEDTVLSLAFGSRKPVTIDGSTVEEASGS